MDMKKMTLWIVAAAALTLTATGALASDEKKEHLGMMGDNHGMKAMAAPSAETLATGKAIYEKTCSVCHDTGVAGAPKLGDKAAWAPHIEEGIDHVVEAAIKGEGAMPPRGGDPSLSDAEVRATVSYMLEQAR
jgi:cytochrome c5